MSNEEQKKEIAQDIKAIAGRKPLPSQVQILNRTEEMNRREKERKAMLEKHPRTEEDNENPLAWLDGPSGTGELSPPKPLDPDTKKAMDKLARATETKQLLTEYKETLETMKELTKQVRQQTTDPDTKKAMDKLKESAELMRRQILKPEPITPFRILYQNHRNEISWRLITPITWKMSPTEYYPEPGLQILTAMDEGKKEVRDFCAKRVLMWNFVGFPDLSEDMYDVTPWTISGITKSDFEKVIHLIKDKFAAAFCDINGQWYVCCTPDMTGKMLFDILRNSGLPGIEMIQGGPIMLPMDFVDSQDTWLVDNPRFDVNPVGN